MVLIGFKFFVFVLSPIAGALLKACFCFNLITLPSEETLEAQLKDKYGGGFELHTWSNLPVGSGLGTSSILAGAVMAALLRSAGKIPLASDSEVIKRTSQF